jgi:phenylalanyl-tRNA synthetase beta chain
LKASLNWLNEFVNLNGISANEISHKLTMAGLEVENIVSQSDIYKGLIVGLIKSKQKHPNADKLSLCTVFDGINDLQVVCGAPNVALNQKVVFAPIGASIPKGQLKIEKVKIRGVESFGMICSEAELEISENHDGIMVLAADLIPGTPITEALALNDIIFEIGITPNRPDALSHIGIARDLAALFDLPLSYPKINLIRSNNAIHRLAAIEIEDNVNCPRYSALVVKNISVKSSPKWLKDRLTNLGLRSINNIVDVTNLIMYEIGQPLHAFDLDLLAGKKIIVKSTKTESIFQTLDSKQRNLPVGTLMICDGEKPVAIAGIMGGENSEVTSATKNILIESAFFNHASIRRTSRALGLSTDASYRFERGTDPNNTLFAAMRAAQLISELSGGEIVEGNLDVYPQNIRPIEIILRYRSIERILGYEVSINRVKSILESLGFSCNQPDNKSLKVVVPTFRPDIEREIDLIEEIARIHGYDNIPTISKISVTLHKRIDESELADRIRNILQSFGFYEMINNPLVSKKLAYLHKNPIQILNPQNIDMEYLRNSLLPSALTVISRNINLGEKDLKLYEIGNVFQKNSSEDINTFSDFTESQKIIFVMTGRAILKDWHSNERFFDFFDLKGIINSFLSQISLDNAINDLYNEDGNNLYEFLLTKSINDNTLGEGGKVKKEILHEFGIEQNVYAFELNIKYLQDLKKLKSKFIEPSKFPKVYRDFAFIFNNSVKAEQVISHIKSEGSVLLKSVKLFDVFEGDIIGKSNKSLAFSLEFGSNERTLTESEIEKVFISLINSITNKFNATLRGN